MSFLRDPKRLLATLIAGVTGLIVLVDFSGTLPLVDYFALTLVGWAALLAALALLVGLLNVVANHVGRVARRREDWGYSLVLLAAMVVFIFAGIGYPLRNDATGELTVPQSLVEQPIRTLFSVVYQPLAASFLALLAFYSLTAALRAVRRRTADALVIVFVALLVLLAGALPQVDTLPVLGDSLRWVNDYLVLAGARGLLIGAALGALVAGVRVLLGFDQPYLDR